ncbi:TlpA family protein disulfide reductase [Flavitalea sp.]|nr:TlpA disulfide reductase family protein [Flavitalea sp.]
MLRITIFALISLSSISASSQQVKAIAIGEEFPSIPKANALNHIDSVINLSDYQNKLLILDFWATWCSSCIGGFPKLDSLQKTYTNDLKIVLVNVSDSPGKIDSFLAKYKQRRGRALGLPTIWDNSEITAMLPHRSIPHYGWVHKGRLIATTGTDEITGKNISAVLDGKTVQFRMKKDIFNFDRNRPMLENGNGGDSAAFRFRSLFAAELQGMNSVYFERKTEHHRRKAYVNLSMAQLFSVMTGIQPYGILLDLPEASMHTGPGNPLFCYEITGPVDTQNDVMTAFSIEDLNRYLNVTASIRFKKIPVYRLVMSAKRKKVAYDTTHSSFMENEEHTELQFNRKKIRFLISHLNYGPTEYPARMPFIDETGYEGTITVAIPDEAIRNISLLRNILAKEGIRVKKGKRNMKVCIIRSNDGKNKHGK